MIWTWIFKLAPAGRAIAQFVGAHWRLSLAAAFALLWWFQRDNLAEARARLDEAEAKIEQLVSANQAAQKAVEDCLRVNESNAAARNAALSRAQSAEQALAVERERRSNDIRTIQNEAREIRVNAGQDCRKLDEPLPADFVQWLRE